MLLPYPEFIQSYVLSYWQPGQKFLEVGCGVSYLRTFIKQDYIGVDITDQDYVDGIKRDVDIVCDGHHIPLDSESIDIIYIKSTLYLMKDIPSALREFRRLLKPGGRLLVFDYNYKTQKKLKNRPGCTYSYSLWTQLGLFLAVKRAGFTKCQLLSAYFPPKKFFKHIIDLLRQEFFGDWANITAIKECASEKSR